MNLGMPVYSEATRIAAEIITRHANPRVGAEFKAGKPTGKYAVYFYDAKDLDGHEIRRVGPFDSPRDAARAIPFIVAATIIEDVSVWDADTEVPDV